MTEHVRKDGTLPLLPLRGIVVFPGSLVQIFVGRETSIAAIKRAMEEDNLILLSTQLQAQTDKPTKKDLYPIGTLASVIRVSSLQDGTAKVMLEGFERYTLGEMSYEESCCVGEYTIIQSLRASEQTIAPLHKLLLGRANEFIQSRQQPGEHALKALSEVAEVPSKHIDIVLGLLPISLEEKYKLLEIDSDAKRLEALIAMVEAQIELLQVDEKIQNRIRQQISKTQREHYLHEQMKAIQKEMSDLDEGKNQFNVLEQAIEKAKMPKEAHEKAKEELEKLRLMSTMSAEATVVRNYLDTLISLPWHKKSKMNSDLARARKQLDEDHHALEDVKERILEYLAAYKRSKKLKAPVLCLVGPPGVGKTSLGKSIAKATNRKFIRLSLGGVRDEAEIRGHRKTYIGSMPGRIIQKMAKAGSTNPLFLLDEIDKMGQDFRGDPASALLEILDPEQNANFNDHYLEIDYDLSNVLFLCTSNSLNIPEALQDRLEIIRLSGYTEHEKIHIASNHLVPRQLQQHRLENELVIDDGCVEKIIRNYTREAGVRELERKIAKIVRRVVYKLESGEITHKAQPKHIKPDKLSDMLGPEKFTIAKASDTNEAGVVNGLAWTRHGGEILKIETLIVAGKGEFVMTGSLGDVMRESVKAAMSVVRSKSHWLHLADDFFGKHDIHIHMPEGATPKDGPSAGIAMCTALFSRISGIPVRANVAMTGELTISGRVLPIGGLKEKVLAAQRSGITTVLLPAENKKDLVEISEDVRKQVNCVTVETIDDVLQKTLIKFDRTWLVTPAMPRNTVSPHAH